MSIVRQQLRHCLIAILIAGLLFAGIATSQAAAAPCGEGVHHHVTDTSVQLSDREPAEINPIAGARQAWPLCCSTVIGCCCVSMAIVPVQLVEAAPQFVRSAWRSPQLMLLHGLEAKVTLPPPRIA